MAGLCTICGASQARVCLRCRSAYYCSVSCQETDYPEHKLLCKNFKTFSIENRPTDCDYRRAIFFPVDGQKPQLIWVRISADVDRDRAQIRELLDINSLRHSLHIEHIRGNKLRGRVTNDHIIELLQQCSEDWSPVTNTSLNSVQGHAWSTWTGNLLVMSKATTDYDPPRYTDISLMDFRDIVDYFYYYRDGLGSATDGIGAEDHKGFHRRIMESYYGKVKVVRVACTGDVQRGLPKLSQIEIPKLHPAFRLADDPPSVTEYIDSPLSAFPERPSAALKSASNVDQTLLENPSIALLYSDIDTDDLTRLGQAEECWARGPGTVLIVNRGRDDVLVQEVELLLDFCRQIVQPLVNTVISSQGQQLSLEDMREEITDKYYELYNTGS